MSNPGTVAARVEEVTLSGEDADSFSLNRGSGARIRAGDDHERSWTVRPAAKLPAGSYVLMFAI